MSSRSNAARGSSSSSSSSYSGSESGRRGGGAQARKESEINMSKRLAVMILSAVITAPLRALL